MARLLIPEVFEQFESLTKKEEKVKEKVQQKNQLLHYKIHDKI